MKLLRKKIVELKRATYNPRKKLTPDDKEYQNIKNSIEEFGYVDPIIINKDNTIIGGHQRLSVLEDLGYEDIDVIQIDINKTKEKALNIALNKITGEWDLDLLNDLLLELDDNGFDITLTGFEDLELNLDTTNNEIDYAEATQEKVENILNLGKANYIGCGKYDIPEILPVYDLSEIKEWIGFNYVLSDKNPTGKAVHFFIDDYQFERIWNNPDLYIEKLKQYECVLSPDFSPYGDMPLATQIFNHYRKHWIGRYLQEHGVNVIPTIRASSDERSYEWYLDGEPHESIVCISSMWTSNNEEIKEMFIKEYNTMYKTLKPKKIFIYGKPIDGLQGNIEYIDSFTESRWKNAKD